MTPIPTSAFYGFYNPAAVANAGAPHAAQQIAQTLMSPIHDADGALSAVETLATILPSCAGLDERNIQFEIVEGLSSVAALVFQRTDKVLIPRGFVPAHDLISFIQGLGTILSRNHVQERASKPVLGTEEQRQNERTQQQSLWAAAYGLSLCFQVALELNTLHVNFMEIGATNIWLRAEDISLFWIFREKGLFGVAEAYPSMLADHVKSNYEALDSSSLRRFGLDIWGSKAVERPQAGVQETFLDDLADRQRHYDALANKNIDRDPLEASALSLFNNILNSGIADESQLLPTLDYLIETIAPDLSLSSVHRRPDVRVILATDERGQLDVLGGAGTTQIIIPRNQPIRNWIGDYLRLIGALSMPPDMLDHIALDRDPVRGQLQRSDLDQKILALATFYKSKLHHQEAWGYAVYFSFRHQAISRGIELNPLSKTELAMERIFKELGFSIFVSRFSDFVPPDEERAHWTAHIRKAARDLGLSRSPRS